MILDLILISVIVCFIVDISGIIDNVEWWLSKWLNRSAKVPKPFSCSLCMTWWVGLIWIIVQCKFTLFNICCVALIAALSEQISNMIVIIKQLIARIQDAIQLWLITKNK